LKNLDRPRRFRFECRNDSAVDPVLGPGACHGGHQLSVGSVADLIFFVFSLMIVAAAVSRLALP
jgi:hypothetical protein